MTPLYGRTFGVWTAVTCMMCLVCASHIHERGIYIATAATFALAGALFTAELLGVCAWGWRAVGGYECVDY